MTADLAHQIMQQHAHWSGDPCLRRAAALRLLVALGRYVLDSRHCRVRVLFSSHDVVLDFQCTREAAERFAAQMQLRADSTIVIDDRIHPDLPPLPCGRLWSA